MYKNISLSLPSYDFRNGKSRLFFLKDSDAAGREFFSIPPPSQKNTLLPTLLSELTSLIVLIKRYFKDSKKGMLSLVYI